MSTLFFFPFAALGFLRVIIASQMIVCCPASQSLSLSVPPASLLANRQLPIRGEQHTYVHGHKAREREGRGRGEKRKKMKGKKNTPGGWASGRTCFSLSIHVCACSESEMEASPQPAGYLPHAKNGGGERERVEGAPRSNAEIATAEDRDCAVPLWEEESWLEGKKNTICQRDV